MPSAIEAILGLSWKDGRAPYVPIAFRLAWRNIARDRTRLAIAVIGVGFAVLLMTVQLGLLIGFATTASSLIDHASADFWIVPRGAKDVDQAGILSERQRYVALGVPGVAAVESLVVRFAEWKRPDGGTQSIIVVGVDPSRPALSPWNFVAGSMNSLDDPNGVIIDDFYADYLGVNRIGQTVEIMKHRARVVGITSGVRTFTQSHFVFTNLELANAFTGLGGDETTYLLVRDGAGASRAAVERRLQSSLPESDVWTASGFSWETRFYWLFTTGAGAAVVVAALLGLVVGIVIVSQVLYSATVERIQEYATIRALGAEGTFLKTIVMRQALFSGAFGYVTGSIVALIVAHLASSASAAISISLSLVLLVAIVTFGMCFGASQLSIRKVLDADPASAFR
jgi:putative ABC transport system permease protein